MRTGSWQLLAAAALLVLLALVATLQYRWLGDVSRAERERLQASVKARAAEFSDSLDADLTRAYAAFQIPEAQFSAEPEKAIAAAAERAARESRTGAVVRDIFVVQAGTDGAVRRLNPGSHALEPTVWPEELTALGHRLASAPALAVAGLPLTPGLVGDAVDGDAPALVVPITSPEMPLPAASRDLFVRAAAPRADWRAIVVWLDRDRLQSQLLAPLVARHFGDASSSDFNVTVASRREGRSLFHSGATDVAAAEADVARDVFALKFADLHWSRTVAKPSAPGDASSSHVQDRVAITIVRRADAAVEGASSPEELGAAWRLLVQARAGSLDAVVARSRLRNLAVSLGVLGVLGASLALILVASAREQRAARQQLEFVAAVSHELRTPLAVIRSAGENLADGVVAGEQVAEYGALIRSEGRRLSDMVERVMDFAGMSAGTLIRARRPTDVGEVAAATVAAMAADARERGVALKVHAGADLPALLADADALRCALQNGIGNAVKYSAAGGVVDVDVAATARTLRVTVSDRGMGIDRDEVPHLFTPFYRGRRAVAAQIRGSGVGLSLVRKIVVAHGGDVRIAAREGGGTVLTMELPVEDGASRGART